MPRPSTWQARALRASARWAPTPRMHLASPAGCPAGKVCTRQEQRRAWRWHQARAPLRPHAPAVQAIIAGLRESVQTFATEVTDVNSRDVMELLVRGWVWCRGSGQARRG